MSDGAEISYTVTWLEATARPTRPRPAAPPGRSVSVLRAIDAPTAFFRYLYDMVGGDYHWTDMHARPDEDVGAFVRDPKVGLYVMYVTGWPAGFIMLDNRLAEVCEIAYFGVAPQVIGQGYGRWLLGTGVHMGWDGGCARMTVNTCSLDHPRALPGYQSWGFAPVRREERRKTV